MFEVVMRLKHCNAHVKLKNDAADTPDITSLGPPQFKDNFRRPKLTHQGDILNPHKLARPKNETLYSRKLQTFHESKSHFPLNKIIETLKRPTSAAQNSMRPCGVAFRDKNHIQG